MKATDCMPRVPVTALKGRKNKNANDNVELALAA
jgi:hypothetical protein